MTQPSSPLHISLRDMGWGDTHDQAARNRKSRQWKRKRIQWLKQLFSHKKPDSDSKKIVTNIKLTGHEVEFLEQIRSGHDARLWKYIPNDVFQFLLDGNLVYDEKTITGPKADMVSNKGLILMAMRCLWLYLLGSSKYNGFLLREMYQVDGKLMDELTIQQRVNRGRLYSQIEQLGAVAQALSDDEFDFADLDDEDWA